MTCDDVRAALIDALATRRPVTDAAVRAHIETCAACQAARDDYDTIWRQLGDLAVPDPRPDARVRFDKRLAGARRASPWYVGAWAATMLVAAIVGYAFGAHRTPDHSGSEPTFLLLFHVDSNFQHGKTPAASAAILADYRHWTDRLTQDGTLIGGEKLGDSTAWFGPTLQAGAHGDHLAGFMMIRVKDRAAAEQIAATCPHLKYGGRIELRVIARS